VLAEEPDLEVNQVVQLLEGRSLRVQRGTDQRHELLAATHEDLPEQVVLALEEGVDRSDRELGQLGDLLEGRLVEALAPEDVLGGVEELQPAQRLVLQLALLAPALRFGRRFDPSNRSSTFCVRHGHDQPWRALGGYRRRRIRLTSWRSA
jgi:hypothetical protein